MAGLGLGGASKANIASSGILIQTTPPPASSNSFTNLDVAMLSQELAANSSNVNLPSDQLTIQYRAPMNMRDCEGRLALGPRQAITEKSADNNDYKKVDGQVIVERYFVQANNGRLELRCDAGRYVTETITAEHPTETVAKLATADNHAIMLSPQKKSNTIYDMGGNNSAVVASGIDVFKVQFAVADGNNTRYVPMGEYRTNGTLSNKPIVSVKLGIMTSGDIPLPRSETVQNPSYILFGKDLALNAKASANQVRRVYESSVMLRNSRDRK